MTIRAIIYADMKSSVTSEVNTISKAFNITGAATSNQIFFNKWGDAFVAGYDSPAAAVRSALMVRDRLRFHDWHASGICRPPLLRIAVVTGDTEWTEEMCKGQNGLEGTAFIEASRIEPIVTPGEVWVSENVQSLCRHNLEFYFKDLGELELAKDYGAVKLYCAYWDSEKIAVEAGGYPPLRDEQFYRRQEAMRRFALLWLLLDQLPIGSWGRSVPYWMKEVWNGIPGFAPSRSMEDEGGFETTILNMELLSRILGQARLMQGIGSRTFEYLQNRATPEGFGTMEYSRHGYAVVPRPRHTALALWLLGDVLMPAIKTIPLFNTFKTGALSLLGGDRDRVEGILSTDRNPVLLYLSTWRVWNVLRTSNDIRGLFTDSELNQMDQNWEHSEKKLRSQVLNALYDGKPSRIGVHKNVYPLTVPYGDFVRMESYSFLTAVMFMHSDMHESIRRRMSYGMEYLLKEYLKDFGEAHRRYLCDMLHPRVRGLKPFFSDNERDVPIDLGTVGLMLRVLRSSHILSALWNTDMPPEIEQVRHYLNEDLVDLFDRYLVEPQIFSLTHPGMLAAAIVGDSPNLLDAMVKGSIRYWERQLPVDLDDNTLDAVLSESRIAKVVEEVVLGDQRKIQMAPHSLVRLLLDRLRPGRYVQERMSPSGRHSVSRRTLSIYGEQSFVERFSQTWGDEADPAIFAPFVAALPDKARILDVGCGAGQYALQFVERGHIVDLLDGSDNMLEHARRRIERSASYSPQCYYCNVLDLSKRASLDQDGIYNAIWCSGLFAHMPNESRVELLTWFRKLLRPDGLLFVNVMIDNPRLLASDGRYYTYVSSFEELERELMQSGLEPQQTLIKRISRNTYGEPIFTATWANFYARPIQGTNYMNSEQHAAVLTQLAYQRSVSQFVEVHQSKSKVNRRTKIINEQLDKLKSYLGSRSDNAIKVLDLGCGPGDFVIEMARRGWDAVGVDASDAMISVARVNCPKELAERIRYFVSDARALPQEWSGRFDGALCVTVLQHIPVEGGAAQNVLSELARILNPGGIARIDVQLGRHSGFDPDLRFIQGYTDSEDVRRKLKFNDIGFEQLEEKKWSLPQAQNSFKREMSFHFAEFWLRKR